MPGQDGAGVLGSGRALERGLQQIAAHAQGGQSGAQAGPGRRAGAEPDVLLGLVGAGLLVLLSLQRGSVAGWTGAALGGAVLIGVGLVQGASAAGAMAAVLLFWGPALLLAELLRRSAVAMMTAMSHPAPGQDVPCPEEVLAAIKRRSS